MKKGFKRFLSGALATVMAVAGMTIGMATTAMAAELSSGNLKSVNGLVTTWDFSNITSNSSNAKANDTIEGIIVLDPGNKTYLKSSDKALSSTSKDNKDPVLAVPVESEEGNVTLVNQANRTDRFVALTVNNVPDENRKQPLSETGNSFDYTSSDITKINDNNYVVFTITGGEAKFEKIEATAVLAKGTGSITGTITGYDIADMTPEPDGKFQYEGIDFTVNYETGSYTIPELSNGTYTITYTGTYYTMEPVEVVVSDQENATVKNLQLTALPKATDVNLNIASATDNTVILTGKTNGMSYTIPLNNGTGVIGKILADTYTVEIGGGTVSPAEFEVTPATTNLTATLTWEYASTIDGPVPEIRFTDDDKLGVSDVDNYPMPKYDVFLDYFTSYGVYQRTNASYGIQVQDFDTKSFEFTTTVPLKLIIGYSSTGGSNTSDISVKAVGADEDAAYGIVTGTSEKELSIDYLPAGTYRIYSPNTFEDAPENGRDVRVHTIEFAAPKKTNITDAAGTTPAVLQNGTDFYVVSVVTQNDVDNYNKLAQNTTQEKLASSETVYRAIQAGGLTYTASDFGGTADDFLFASIIDSQGAEADTVLSSIQSNVTTALSNE